MAVNYPGLDNLRLGLTSFNTNEEVINFMERLNLIPAKTIAFVWHTARIVMDQWDPKIRTTRNWVGVWGILIEYLYLSNINFEQMSK